MHLFHWIKFVKFVKLLKICYGINITYIQSPNKDHLKYLKFKFQHAYSFSCLWKKDGKFFAKNIVTFWHTKFEVTITKISIENIITHQWLALIPIWNIYIYMPLKRASFFRRAVPGSGESQRKDNWGKLWLNYARKT